MDERVGVTYRVVLERVSTLLEILRRVYKLHKAPRYYVSTLLEILATIRPENQPPPQRIEGFNPS